MFDRYYSSITAKEWENMNLSDLMPIEDMPSVTISREGEKYSTPDDNWHQERISVEDAVQIVQILKTTQGENCTDPDAVPRYTVNIIDKDSNILYSYKLTQVAEYSLSDIHCDSYSQQGDNNGENKNIDYEALLPF